MYGDGLDADHPVRIDNIVIINHRWICLLFEETFFLIHCTR